MNALIRFSMNKIAAIMIIIAILFGGGLYAGSSLKVENMPDVSFPYLFITTAYPASPQDVMTLVTTPIETKIANMPDLELISSTSNDGLSSISLQFRNGIDVDKTKQELESLVQEIALPASASRPKVASVGFASIPAYYLAVYADESMSQLELDRIFEEELKPGFEALGGIDHLDAIGSRSSSLDIQVDAGAVTAYGMSLPLVTDAIQGALQGGSVGSVKLDGHTQTARVTGNLDSTYNLHHLEMTTPGGQTLLLRDIARIKMIHASEFVARIDGKPAIGVHLYKTKAANAVHFSNETNALLEQWADTYPDIHFKKIYDAADEVTESISGLLREGLIGIALASLMILVFLRNFRMTLIVLVSIPLSILITLMMMHGMNLTLNVMSLGGMFIAVGRIVDDSIVVIESVYTHLQRAQERNESVILLATRQVAMAISSSTFVTAGVFLPIAFVDGFVGDFFRPFAITVACALMASLLVALTVIPMMAKLMVLRGASAHHPTEEHAPGRTALAYDRLLRWCLKHRIKTMLTALLMFVVTLAVTIPNLAVAELPENKTDRQMNFTIKLPTETPFDSTNLLAERIESLLKEKKGDNGEPLFTFVEALVGYDWGTENVPYALEILTEVQERADPRAIKTAYEQMIAAQLPEGSKVLPGSLAGGTGYVTTDFSYVLYGEDQLQLAEAAAQIERQLKTFPELLEIKTSLGEARTELQIAVNPSNARLFGLSPASIRQAVGEWIAVQPLGDVRFDNIVYKTKLELDPADKASIEMLAQLPLQSAIGGIVKLGEVATLSKVKAPLELNREDQKLMVKITAVIDSPDKAGVSAKVSEALRAVKLPAGISTDVKGASEDIAASFSKLFVAMGAATAIVYLIMVLAFGNAGTPFAILFALPLAVIGGLLGLWMANESINITSLIGFMMLIGIVVTNAIVLLERTEQLRKEGLSAREALLESGRVRLRPILMTAGATIAAMIPLALGFSHGTLISKGLAVVVIGGLLTSTFLTLVVVPVVYEWIEAVKERLSRTFKRDAHRTLLNKTEQG